MLGSVACSSRRKRWKNHKIVIFRPILGAWSEHGPGMVMLDFAMERPDSAVERLDSAVVPGIREITRFVRMSLKPCPSPDRCENGLDLVVSEPFGVHLPCQTLPL